MSDAAHPGFDVSKHHEEIVLGAMLRCPSSIDEVAPLLRPDDFAWFHHQLVYRAVLDLWDRGAPVTLEALANLLHERKQIEELGGYKAIAALWEATATGADGLHFAKVVCERALVRRLNTAAGEIVRRTSEADGTAAELLEDAEQRILSVAEVGFTGSTTTLKQGIDLACDRIDQRAQRGGRASGLPTGFLDLDERTAGLQDSELIVLAARPGAGKTSFGLQVARHVALEEGRAVYIVSLEMSLVELSERLLCSEGDVDGHKLRQGVVSAEDGRRLKAARARLERANVHVDDQPRLSMLRISANARRLRRQHNIGLIVIDYLQLIEPENRRDPRHEQVAQISRRLKWLARELKAPVLALAQLNRSIEGRKGDRPRLADLRESGEIEQNADVVMLLHKPSDLPRVVEVIIAKQRNGPVGIERLVFDPARTKFKNYQPDFPPPGVG
jgi:replicative DNA helicase